MGDMVRSFLYLTLCVSGATLPGPACAQELSLDGFDAQEIVLLQSTVELLDPFVSQRRSAGTAPLVTFEELYAHLMPQQMGFLERFRRIDPAKTGGSNRRHLPPAPDTPFVRLEGQMILREGRPVPLDVQYLPRQVYEAYRRMMAAMEQDLGKRLLVESGYRSSAYQMYLFLFYMPKHGTSILETNRFVALPGFSEHGSPARQAIDFITPGGINGEDRPEEFEELQEYGWLQARAKEFGFHLSYPRNLTGSDPGGSDPNSSSAFEPWHWHFESGGEGSP